MINNKLIFDDALITVTELADMLHVSKSAIYGNIYKSRKLSRPPMFQPVKLCGKLYFRCSEIQETIKSEFDKPLRIYPQRS